MFTGGTRDGRTYDVAPSSRLRFRLQLLQLIKVLDAQVALQPLADGHILLKREDRERTLQN